MDSALNWWPRHSWSSLKISSTGAVSPFNSAARRTTSAFARMNASESI